MTHISQNILTLTPPEGDQKIGKLEKGYFRGKLRNDLHSAFLEAFQKSGLSKAQLARRLGKRPEVVSRYFGGGSNWTVDTVSDLFLALDGLVIPIEPTNFFDLPASNGFRKEWLAEDENGIAQVDIKSSTSTKNSISLDDICVSSSNPSQERRETQ